MDLWVIFVKPLEPKQGQVEAQYLGKQLAPSGKKMMICLKSSIYDEMPENIFGFTFVAPNFEVKLSALATQS